MGKDLTVLLFDIVNDCIDRRRRASARSAEAAEAVSKWQRRRFLHTRSPMNRSASYFR